MYKRQPLKRFPFDLNQTLDDKTVHLVQRALVYVGEQGSARRARAKLPAGFQFAGKTGTSGSQRDSWFAGFTGDMLAVVWLGNDDNTPTALTGSSGALPVWADLIASASKQPLNLAPRSDMDYVLVDAQTGEQCRRRCRAYCQEKIELPFIKQTAPSPRSACR